MTIRELVEHYRQHELPRKAFSTQQAYQSYLNENLLPTWGNHKLNEVKAVAVEEWLATLKFTNGTKAKLRNILSALFTHAQRWEIVDKNPIRFVRQATKRTRQPQVLTDDEIVRLLAELQEPARTAVYLACATGLRVSELLALQWQDIDFDNHTLTPVRGIVDNHVGPLKTEASGASLPCSQEVCDTLNRWRSRSKRTKPADYVFQTPRRKASQPYWPENFMRKLIHPAVQRAGINKRVGWHSFRHTTCSRLIPLTKNVRLVQEIMRHANARTTLEVYAQTTMPEKLALQAELVKGWNTQDTQRDRAAF